jgi:hypothetical protein
MYCTTSSTANYNLQLLANTPPTMNIIARVTSLHRPVGCKNYPTTTCQMNPFSDTVTPSILTYPVLYPDKGPWSAPPISAARQKHFRTAQLP